MKLYYSAGSCSTCCHIALEEAGLSHEAIAVDFDQTSDPNFIQAMKLNGMGTLPVLDFGNGKALTQNLSILTYIADNAPEKKLLPAQGTFERAEAMTWLSFVAADLHKAVGGLFGVPHYSTDAAKKEEYRAYQMKSAEQTLSYLNANLAGKDYLMGKQYTVADAYAFIVVGWTKWLNVSLDAYPNIQSYMGRILERPATQKVFKIEGLA